MHGAAVDGQRCGWGVKDRWRFHGPEFALLVSILGQLLVKESKPQDRLVFLDNKLIILINNQ